jgi:hypothetical protein
MERAGEARVHVRSRRLQAISDLSAHQPAASREGPREFKCSSLLKSILQRHKDKETHEKWIALKMLVMASRYREPSILRAVSSERNKWRHSLDDVVRIAKKETWFRETLPQIRRRRKVSGVVTQKCILTFSELQGMRGAVGDPLGPNTGSVCYKGLRFPALVGIGGAFRALSRP